MSEEQATRLAADTREVPYRDSSEWVSANAGRLRDVDLPALLAEVDRQHSVFEHERQALEALIGCARRTRPEAIPALLSRLVELLKRLSYEHELPTFHECVLTHAAALPRALYHAVLLDLFLFYGRVSESYGLWWYALAWRDVTKLLLCLAPIECQYGSSVAGDLPRRACTRAPWDIPYLDLLILLGHVEDRPDCWRDAADCLFPRLPGGAQALAEANRLLDGARRGVRRPALAPPDEMRTADGREDGTRAAFALRVVAHFAAAEGYEFNLASDLLAPVVFAALEQGSQVGLRSGWGALSKAQRAELAWALEACDPAAAARMLGRPVPDPILDRVAAAGFGGPGPLDLRPPRRA